MQEKGVTTQQFYVGEVISQMTACLKYKLCSLPLTKFVAAPSNAQIVERT